MDLSIIIPVYRGELTLPVLVEKIHLDLKDKFSFEIIPVWDCGPDNSWSVIQNLAKKYPDSVKPLSLTRNYGQHNAIIAGISQATGDYIVTMDEDLQHDPADIIPMLAKQHETSCDVVYGNPVMRKHAFWRNTTSNLLKLALRYALPALPSYYSAFRLIRKDIAGQLQYMRSSYTFLDGYLSWITSSFAECPVEHHERFAGKSGYTFKKLLSHTITIFVTFSNLPLRLLTALSILIFGCASCYAMYVLWGTLFKDHYSPGFPSIIIAISMGIGLVLGALGIIGEYIYQINQKTTRRPGYIIRTGRTPKP